MNEMNPKDSNGLNIVFWSQTMKENVREKRSCFEHYLNFKKKKSFNRFFTILFYTFSTYNVKKKNCSFTKLYCVFYTYFLSLYVTLTII